MSRFIVGSPQSSPDLARSQKPHVAVITMKIDIRAMEPDGTLDECVMGERSLSKYRMTPKAILKISGPSEAACVKNVKDLLERLNG